MRRRPELMHLSKEKNMDKKISSSTGKRQRNERMKMGGEKAMKWDLKKGRKHGK
jgi:hypothetical protein